MATSPVGTRRKPRISEGDGKGIWSSLLDSVAADKRFSEKTLLVVGGTQETQREFLDALAEEDSQQRSGAANRHGTNKKPTVANRFALGYTYQDILDADHDDVLARVSIYVLANQHPAFAKLLNPLFTPKTVKDMLVVVLLNWEDPWSWMRTLRDWVRILRDVLDSTDGQTKEAMEESMQEWRERRKAAGSNTDSSNENDVALPVGPGEWDEPLGVPLCVVCQHAEKIDILEREHGWKDDEFDAVLQYLRTVLVKHGASLIYTASAAPGQLQTLIRSSLGVESLLQKNPLKHNVVDRDKIFVPPNWDSWGKIRVLKESFDVESISQAWSVEIQESVKVPSINGHTNEEGNANEGDHEDDEPDDSTVVAYEQSIKAPTRRRTSEEANAARIDSGKQLEVECQTTQEFLAQQHQVLEKLKVEDEQARKAKDVQGSGSGTQTPASRDDAGRVSEHIGPVQFNVGGIQVDADDMLRSLKDREAGRTASEERSFSPSPDGKLENDKLNAFFAGLMSRSTNSPSPGPK